MSRLIIVIQKNALHFDTAKIKKRLLELGFNVEDVIEEKDCIVEVLGGVAETEHDFITIVDHDNKEEPIPGLS